MYDDLAEAWWKEKKPDLTVVYLQSTDAVGHVFAPFRPPRRPGIRQEDVDRYGAIPDRVYDEVPRLWTNWVFDATGTTPDVRTRLVRAKHGDASGVRAAARLRKDGQGESSV